MIRVEIPLSPQYVSLKFGGKKRVEGTLVLVDPTMNYTTFPDCRKLIMLSTKCPVYCLFAAKSFLDFSISTKYLLLIMLFQQFMRFFIGSIMYSYLQLN